MRGSSICHDFLLIVFIGITSTTSALACSYYVGLEIDGPFCASGGLVPAGVTLGGEFLPNAEVAITCSRTDRMKLRNNNVSGDYRAQDGNGVTDGSGFVFANYSGGDPGYVTFTATLQPNGPSSSQTVNVGPICGSHHRDGRW